MASDTVGSDLSKSLRTVSEIRIWSFRATWDRSFVVQSRKPAIPILEFLKLEADFDYLVDITGVDYPSVRNASSCSISCISLPQ